MLFKENRPHEKFQVISLYDPFARDEIPHITFFYMLYRFIKPYNFILEICVLNQNYLLH